MCIYRNIRQSTRKKMRFVVYYLDMKIAIIGGRIRGTEIAILARSAGIYTVLIDKDKLTPASGLCAENYVFDVVKKEPALTAILKNVDIVIPAVECKDALNAVEEMCREINIKVAFDFIAYSVTNAKIQTDYLINEEGFSHLKYYPEAEPPYILKPAEGNRRRSIIKVDTLEELESIMNQRGNPDSWIAQEYVDGMVYSLEVIGEPGRYKTYEITEVSLSSDFDSSMVLCPSSLDPERKKTLIDAAITLAEKIQLKGIMSIEAIEDDGILKIIEIHNLFPTQTPVTVLYSTGINMLVEFLKVFADERMMEKLDKIVNEEYVNKKYVAHKNFQFLNQTPTFLGEGEMDKAGSLKLMVDFFGTDYAITDYIDDDHEWQAAFINIADTIEKLTQKRISSRERVLQHCRKQL